MKEITSPMLLIKGGDFYQDGLIIDGGEFCAEYLHITIQLDMEQPVTIIEWWLIGTDFESKDEKFRLEVFDYQRDREYDDEGEYEEISCSIGKIDEESGECGELLYFTLVQHPWRRG